MTSQRLSVSFESTADLQAFYRDFGIDFSIPGSERLMPLLKAQLLTCPSTEAGCSGYWTVASLTNTIAYVRYTKDDSNAGCPHIHLDRWWFDTDQKMAALIRSFHVELNEIILACPLEECELPEPIRTRLDRLASHVTERLIEGRMRPHTARETLRRIAMRLFAAHAQAQRA